MSRVLLAANTRYGTAPLGATYSTPFTFCARFNPSATPTSGIVSVVGGTGYIAINMYLTLYQISTPLENVSSGIATVVGTQANIMVVANSATSRMVYVDGFLRATGTGNETITAATLQIGRENTGFYTSGTIQDAAFWNRALTAGEALAFHRGASPSLMPVGLKAYVPLWGNNSPEPNYCGTSMTLFNTPPKGTAMLNIL